MAGLGKAGAPEIKVGIAPTVAVDANGSVGKLDWLAVIKERGTAVGLVEAREKE